MEVYLSREHSESLHLLPISVNKFHFPPNNPWNLTIEKFIGPIDVLGERLKGTELRGRDDLSALNALAERIEVMYEQDRAIFSAALKLEDINGPADALRIANSLDSYMLFQRIRSDRELGRALVNFGLLDIDFPQQTLPYLDYEAIGAGYREVNGGAFTPDGYVRRKNPEPVLAEDEKSVLRLTQTTPKGDHVLGLPASDERWNAAKRALDAEEFAQATVSSVEFAAPQLKDLIPVGLITVEEAQALAECLQEIKQNDELMKYCSVLAVEDPSTFSEALTIAMDIDDYERVPEDPAEYGRHNLHLDGAGDEILDMLNGYTDFEQLGRDIMKEECVRRTEFGLVRRLSEPFPPEQQIGQTMS